jgi:quinone-modifying oxidoreductase subunit QmoA
MKQATYVQEVSPDAEITIFYIDLRAPGRYEDFLRKLQDAGKVAFVKGKVAKITEDPSTKNVTVEAEDVVGGKKIRKEVDMVVLATGMVPQNDSLPFKTTRDDYGFLVSSGQTPGVYGAGCAKKPIAVAASLRDATGAALLAMAKGGR